MQRKFQSIILGAGLTILVLIGAFVLLSEQVQGSAIPSKATAPITDIVAVNTNNVSEQSPVSNNGNLLEVDDAASEKLLERETAYSPLTEVDIIIQTVAEFVQKQKENLLGKSGWIHVVAQPYVLEEQRGSNSLYVGSTGEVISSDKLVPDSAQFETWYRVNETGIYNEAISLVTSPNGVIHQQSVLVGNQWLNLTLKARGVTQSEYSTNNPSNEIVLPVVTAANILNDMSTWENVNLQAQVENGVYVVSADQTFAEPLEDAILAKRVLVGRQIFTFDAKTGQLLMTESHLQIDDGTWILRERWTYSTTEFDSELPAIVAEIFSDSMSMVEEK